MAEDPWDYVHITSWNFLPFVLRRVGEAPERVVRVCFLFWIAGLAGLIWALWQLRKVLGVVAGKHLAPDPESHPHQG